MTASDQIYEDETVVETHDEWATRKLREKMVVTMRQARLALFYAGLLDQIPSIIEALDEPDRTIAEIEWSGGSSIERNHPFVQMLAPALGLDDAALDDLFRQAATL